MSIDMNKAFLICFFAVDLIWSLITLCLYCPQWRYHRLRQVHMPWVNLWELTGTLCLFGTRIGSSKPALLSYSMSLARQFWMWLCRGLAILGAIQEYLNMFTYTYFLRVLRVLCDCSMKWSELAMIESETASLGSRSTCTCTNVTTDVCFAASIITAFRQSSFFCKPLLWQWKCNMLA